jgi:hypothetical protein
MVMDTRIAELEARMHGLTADIEQLKTALCSLQERTQTDWFVELV